MRITHSGQTLGARIDDLDLSQPLDDTTFATLQQALGQCGVLWYPHQQLEAIDLKRFAERFGTLEVNVANSYQEPGIPEVMVLSNIVRDGKPLGLADAGQSWHTDMSYSSTIAFTNILYGIQIPQRNGRSLGNTEFCNMHAAYDDLPNHIKTRLASMTITHDFNKFWEMMRRERGSTRAPLTDAQRAAKPPVRHPVFLTHPLTGHKVLYANPGYAMRINELSEDESEDMLAFLFEHQTQPRYRYAHDWKVGDVLMWDNIGTIHNAVADYRADEPRLIKRCQVMADRVFGALA
ncbi:MULTISPECIES: TauD/TfdA family dioxygenase [Paraburkholderia]|uniref:TauD/TfdA dioxygenase family protein n=1 Tax=Paraburkholderia TaxID=1822464 RepID=UPI0022520A4D|nr:MULTISPECIES: TauD/TfdA family dioxygenase [Paraburkholderia]MCX4160009.1 TauD/TfdA family dioxygenase [Paraburkholderia megapolitana]MDN7155509.1 TauD/TfdA family dioxygenase [Paraburkholderia sp. CHISQ3]MDQ6492553.1 TauD/TfdA family dioxygenase [Paraburkholderia megapolitana]